LFLLKTNYTPDKNTIVINSIFHADYVVFVHTYTCTVVFVHSYTLKCLWNKQTRLTPRYLC